MYPICSFKGKTEAAQNKQEKLVQPEVGVGNKYRLAALVKKIVYVDGKHKKPYIVLKRL